MSRADTTPWTHVGAVPTVAGTQAVQVDHYAGTDGYRAVAITFDRKDGRQTMYLSHDEARDLARLLEEGATYGD